jgi:hypothetical protein
MPDSAPMPFQLGVILAGWLGGLACVWLLWRLYGVARRGLRVLFARLPRAGLSRHMAASIIVLVACGLLAGAILLARDVWYDFTCSRLQQQYRVNFCGQLHGSSREGPARG